MTRKYFGFLLLLISMLLFMLLHFVAQKGPSPTVSPSERKTPHDDTHGTPHYGTHGVLHNYTHGTPHDDTHGTPHDTPHDTPHYGTHGVLHNYTHGIPHNDTNGIPHNGTHGIPQNDTHGIPHNGTHGIPQNDTHFVRKFQHLSYVMDGWSQGKPECLVYENPNITLFSEISDTFWDLGKTQHVTNRDVQPILYGSLYAQNYLYQSQHPTNCSNAKYAIVHYHPCGIGSSLHVIGVGLALSVQMDRIMIYEPMPVGHWAHGNFCTSDHSWGCFFHHPSSCTPTPEQLLSQKDWNYKYDDPNPVIYLSAKHVNIHTDFAPEGLQHLLKCSPIPLSHRYWWWRVQSSTYLVRPNRRTIDEMERLKKIVYLAGDIEEGTVSVHVRHGDKSSEMNLVSFDKYIGKVQKLVEENKFVKKKVYLGTEDNKVIEDAMKINEINVTWQYNWIQEERNNDDYGIMQREGDKRVLLDLLGLQLHLQCDAHVGTLQSNWCRLIVELASTIGYCAGCPYIEVGHCPNLRSCLGWR